MTFWSQCSRCKHQTSLQGVSLTAGLLWMCNKKLDLVICEDVLADKHCVQKREWINRTGAVVVHCTRFKQRVCYVSRSSSVTTSFGSLLSKCNIFSQWYWGYVWVSPILTYGQRLQAHQLLKFCHALCILFCCINQIVTPSTHWASLQEERNYQHQLLNDSGSSQTCKAGGLNV